MLIPVQDCNIRGKKGKKYGPEGHCYLGVGAELRAKTQGRAIEASKHAAKSNEIKTDLKEDVAKPDLKSLIAEEKGGAKQYQAYAEDDPKNKKVWEQMAADETKHAGLLAELKTNGATLHTNNIAITSKPLYKDEHVTVVPIRLSEEGVHNGGLKDFDSLHDPTGLEGWAWFERKPIVDGHPGFAVNHLVKKYGYIQNVEPDAVNKTVPAEAVLFNHMFTDSEMVEIDAGHWRGVSIGYYCSEIKENGIWKDGTPYDHREVGPIFADHVALTNRPACKLCGINTNAECTNCGKCKSKSMENQMTKEDKPAETGTEGALAANKQAEPLVMNEDLKAKANKAIQKIEQKIKANSMPEGMAERAEAILKLPDDFMRQKAALDFVLDIALMEEDEGDEMATNAAKDGDDADDDGDKKCPKTKDKEPPVKKNEDSVMKELEPLVKSVTDLTALVQNQANEIKDLKDNSKKLTEKEQLRENALKADEEKKLSDSIKVNFDKAYQMDWDKHWPKIKENALGITGFLADKENLKHWDPKANESVEVEPVGLSFASIQENVVTRGGLKMMSIEELGKKQYPGAYAKQQKEAGKA